MEKTIKYMNIEEQMQHLQDNGLIIHDKNLAIKYLTDIGYYKLINGYRGPFLCEDKSEIKYCKDSSIDDIFNLYCFDQRLKDLIFTNISHSEDVKTELALTKLISR